MGDMQPINISLPEEMVTMIKAKVLSGEYASASEVIQAGLDRLQDRDAAFESWLRTDVAESYDAFTADPASGIPIEDVMGRIMASYDARPMKSEHE